jgi:hypothetical protein
MRGPKEKAGVSAGRGLDMRRGFTRSERDNQCMSGRACTAKRKGAAEAAPEGDWGHAANVMRSALMLQA